MPRKMRLYATNKLFSETEIVFRKACKLAGVEPTTRQASRFRNKKGSAFRFRRQAINVNKEK